MTGPNLVTLSRLGLLAGAVVSFWLEARVAAVALGALAGLTDYVDGWWARRTGQVTRVGEILDQFCDVALETVLLVMAVSLVKSAFLGWSCLPLLMGVMTETPALLRVGQSGVAVGLALAVASGVVYTRVFVRGYDGARA